MKHSSQSFLINHALQILGILESFIMTVYTCLPFIKKLKFSVKRQLKERIGYFC